MSLLENNLTFAVVVDEVSWRSDLTVRFCEYFSSKINEDFIDKIIFPSSIDDALLECKTDYLIIQSSGHIIYDLSFLTKIEATLSNQSDLVLGYIELSDDYAVLNPKCLVVNMLLWNEMGKPLYVGDIREGNTFTYEGDNRKPSSITSLPKRTFIEHTAATHGAGFMVKQLEKFNVATSLSIFPSHDEAFYLDDATPYSEIYTDTFFEQCLLKNTFNKVFTNAGVIESELDFTIDILVVPSTGLRAYSLVQHFKPKKVIIYDINQHSLELQQLIFNVKEPRTYGEVLSEFSDKFPSVILENVSSLDRHQVINVTSTPVETRLINVFSFEMVELIKSLNHDESILIDFDDIFVYPYNYFRKPLYMVNALWVEMYSLICGRQGPSYVFGLTPGWTSMNDVETNTSMSQYHVNDLIDYSVPEQDREPIKPEDVMFIPRNDVAKIPEDTSGFSLISSLKNLVSKPRVVFKEVIVEKVKEAPAPVKTEPSENASIEELAEYFGYRKSPTVEGIINYSKVVDLVDFVALYIYSVNGNVWSFRVSREGFPKQVEFSNGINLDGLRKHLRMETKINSKTASRYYK